MAANATHVPAVNPAPHDHAKRTRGASRTALLLCILIAFPLAFLSASAQAIPPTQATALDGHAVALPHDLPARATVLIIGFGRHSQDATTAWEKPVRQQLAQAGSISFYDIAMLAEVPGFVRPLVLRAIRHEVPDVLKPNFLPLTGEEDAWKHTAGYLPDQPEAAYVLLVDRAGRVQWATHAAFTPAGFAELSRRAHLLANSQQ